MRVVGVDAGVEGAYALHDSEEGSIVVEDIPLLSDRTLDTYELFTKLLEFAPDRLVTERTFKQPKLTAMTAEIVAVSKILQLDYFVVAVSTWKKRLIGEVTNDKERSKQRCRELMPTAQIRKPRARTDSADRAEAVLLALYGLRL